MLRVVCHCSPAYEGWHTWYVSYVFGSGAWLVSPQKAFFLRDRSWDTNSLFRVLCLARRQLRQGQMGIPPSLSDCGQSDPELFIKETRQPFEQHCWPEFKCQHGDISWSCTLGFCTHNCAVSATVLFLILLLNSSYLFICLLTNLFYLCN